MQANLKEGLQDFERIILREAVVREGVWSSLKSLLAVDMFSGRSASKVCNNTETKTVIKVRSLFR